MNHLLQLRAGYFALLCIWLFVNEAHLLHAVSWAEQQKAFAGQTIAPCPAGLLIVTLDIFWQVVVNHIAYVRLVNAHAEGNSRANNPDFIAKKCLLIF